MQDRQLRWISLFLMQLYWKREFSKFWWISSFPRHSIIRRHVKHFLSSLAVCLLNLTKRRFLQFLNSARTVATVMISRTFLITYQTLPSKNRAVNSHKTILIAYWSAYSTSSTRLWRKIHNWNRVRPFRGQLDCSSIS